MPTLRHHFADVEDEVGLPTGEGHPRGFLNLSRFILDGNGNDVSLEREYEYSVQGNGWECFGSPNGRGNNWDHGYSGGSEACCIVEEEFPNAKYLTRLNLVANGLKPEAYIKLLYDWEQANTPEEREAILGVLELSRGK